MTRAAGAPGTAGMGFRLADVTDPRFTAEQLDTVAAFETAVTPPEVREAAVVEALRDALLKHHPIAHTMTGPLSGCRCGQVKLGQDVIAHVAAELRAAQDGGAEEAVCRVEGVATVWEGVADTWQETADHPNTGPEFRAHCLAERDDFRDRVAVLRAALAPQAGEQR